MTDRASQVPPLLATLLMKSVGESCRELLAILRCLDHLHSVPGRGPADVVIG
jgi:hypothetical protein